MKIWNEILLIDKLRKGHKLTAEEYKILLECQDSNCLSYLQKQAQEETLSRFGNRVFIRGLIEISNRCRNNCYYCGIRKGNPSVTRYGLTRETILTCCREGYEAGFRTFVMQGGEDPAMTDEWIEQTVSSVRQLFPDCAITLSLGEKTREAYERFFRAGANRYLLRHETYNQAHYRQLHPPTMSSEHRLQCLQWLKEIGYQTGCGFMVGSPYQTFDTLYEDLQFIRELQPEMVGIGPFIPQKDTPFGKMQAGTIEWTLRLLSIIRLLHPSVLLPATTALGTIHPKGRELGILAGANVVMPNLSPVAVREKYKLYDNKICTGDEAAECRYCMERRMESIGYQVAVDRGDFI